MPDLKPTLEYARPQGTRDIWDVGLQVFFILMIALCLTWLAVVGLAP